MNEKFLQFVLDKNAVNIVIGHILNLMILTLITGSIIGAFYLRVEDSSNQAISIGFTDLGSQIARDITNIYIIVSRSENINLNIKRNIPLTIGGKGYIIEVKDANSTSDGRASVNIKEEGIFGREVITKINVIDTTINSGGISYSGSGKINIETIKNSSGVYIRII